MGGAILAIPNLQAGLSSSSLSSLIRLIVAVSSQPIKSLGFSLLAAWLLISWLGLSAVILANRSRATGPTGLARSLFGHYGRLIATGILAGVVLIGLAIIGLGLAYGLGQWYFGAVIPVGAATIIIIGLFGLWLIFFPFSALWDDKSVWHALSFSRRCAGLVFGRLISLSVGFGLLGAYGTLQLLKISPWLAGVVPIILIPIYLSLLGSLYAEARTKTGQ